MERRNQLIIFIWLVTFTLVFQLPSFPYPPWLPDSPQDGIRRAMALGGNNTLPSLPSLPSLPVPSSVVPDMPSPTQAVDWQPATPVIDYPAATPIISHPAVTPIISRPSATSVISLPTAATGFQITVTDYQGTVPPDKVFTISFTSPVNVLTVSGNIKVISTSGQEVPVRITAVLPDCLKVTVAPLYNYSTGNYTLRTYDGLKDMAGRSPANGIGINFTVAGEPQPDAIQITPLHVSLLPGQQVKFTASYSNGTSSQPMNWRVIGASWGGSTGSTGSTGSGASTGSTGSNSGSADFYGAISANGVYQAPMQPGTYTIEVRSTEFPLLVARSTVVVEQPPPMNIDLELSNAGLNIPGNVHPGDLITLKARVSNKSASGLCPGGTTVRFMINDRTIDEVPIYIKADEASVEARIWYYMPETSEYKAMEQGDSIPLNVTAVVDPYGRLTETDEGNNSAAGNMNVLYAYDTPLKDTDPQLYVDATSLSVWSAKDDAPSDRVAAAQPGQKLRLKALIYYSGSDSSEDINIKFLIDGQVVLNDNRRVGVLGGNFEASCNYQVPFCRTGELDFQVLLSNGSAAGITVPVQRYDVGIMPGDLYWASEGPAVPGQDIYLHALVKNISSINFPHEDARIAWRALIDGQFFAEGDYKLHYDELNMSLPVYRVPQNRAGPILLTIITDVYGQLDESNEANNIAFIEIPVVADNLPGANLYVEPVDLLYQAAPAVPGSTLTLSADIHKNGMVPLTRDVEVQFKINGTAVASKTISWRLFKPMQAYQVSVEWKDTIGLPPGDAILEVVIDPENFNAETDETDNSASMTIAVARPDLFIAGNGIRWDPEQPPSGTTVHIKAVVSNIGDGPAINSKIRFFADSQPIGTGDVILEQIDSASAAYAELDWNIPPTPVMYIPYPVLTGQTGKLQVPDEIIKEVQITVQADPDQSITEKNEVNNLSAGKSMSVILPTERKFVYIRVLDSIGSVSDAKVTLAAENGETADALSDNSGWCSFTGVPAGNYTIRIEKEYYHTYTAGGQVQITSAPQYRQFLVGRTSDYIGMSGTDSDGDMVSDADEAFCGTLPNVADSDNDGVIDGRDISPLTDPADPEQVFLQAKGMIRYEQVIGLHGLDGKVDVYDWEWHFSTMSSSLYYSCTYQSKGTYTSSMDHPHYIQAINKAYDTLHYKVRALSDITAGQVRPDVAVNYPELYNDSTYEANYVQAAGGALHQTEYRIDYNFIVDYQTASLKNSEEIRYPDEDRFFGYLLLPVRISNGHKHTFTFQFLQSNLADKIYYNDDSYYHQLGFQYTIYRSDDFDNDANTPDMTGIALAENDGSDLFRFSITLPADDALLSQYYLKITPAWVDVRDGNTAIEPVWDFNANQTGFNWNLTGLTREVVYSHTSDGGSKIVTESLASIAGLNTDPAAFDTISSLAVPGSANYDPAAKSKSVEAGTLTYNPNDPDGNFYQGTEMDQNIISYVGSGSKYMKNTFKGVETVNIIYSKGGTVDEFPAGSIFRTPAYKSLTAGLDLIGGIVSIYTNGTEAWQAWQNNDKILCAYYVLKTAGAAGESGIAMVKISTNVAALAGATGRFAKFPADSAGTGIAIVIGVIDFAYNAFKYTTATNAVQETAYAEDFVSSGMDLIFCVASVLYPPLAAFEITWFALHEIYGFIHGKDTLSYSLSESWTDSLLFIYEYIAEEVPSQYANEGYKHAVNRLYQRFEIIRSDNEPFVPVFVDPTE